MLVLIDGIEGSLQSSTFSHNVKHTYSFTILLKNKIIILKLRLIHKNMKFKSELLIIKSTAKLNYKQYSCVIGTQYFLIKIERAPFVNATG